jgi:hypothetical protein
MKDRVISSLLSAVLFSLLLGGSHAGAQTPSEFPRLGGMLIGDPHNYDERAYQAQIARLDLAILGFYNGWRGSSVAVARAVNAIKSRNPGILLGNYSIMTEVPRDESDSATAYKRDKLRAGIGPAGIGDWWAYDQNGNHTDWSGGTYPTWDANLTLLTTPDAGGQRWPQWLAQHDLEYLFGRAPYLPIPPAFDLWYSDNNFWRPRVDADWNRDGSNDSRDNLAVRKWWRDGQRAYYDEGRRLAPDLLLMVNADSDLDGSVFPPGADHFKQYHQAAHGAFLEHTMGKSWSVETWGGWPLLMQWYHHIGTNLLPPAIVLFDVYLPSTTDYQSFRYAFASCLMDDGYFSGSTDYNQIVWFDEFDLAGTASTKWLGRAVDPPPTAAWQNGVYQRRFQKGLVLVNPKGNGPRNVTLPPGYARFSGNQDRAVNNGQPVTSLTLSDRDGILLVKIGQRKQQ